MGSLASRLEEVVVADNSEESEPLRWDFESFYRAEFASLVVLATAVLGRRIGAEDVAQEAMLDAHRRWDRLGSYDAPRAWVRTVVVQRSIKDARKRANESVAHLRSVAGTSPAELQPAELDPQIRDALHALPTQQRAALALHYLCDCSLVEIADTLGIAQGTVKTHLQRGRRQMATSLTDDDRGTT